jgi:hypothetical protein
VGAWLYLDATASYDLIDDGERRRALFANVRTCLTKILRSPALAPHAELKDA